MSQARVLLGFTVVLALTSIASACPVCDTGTGRAVREGIFDGDFGRNLLATLLPFAVLLGTVAVIHFGVPRPRAGKRPPSGRKVGDDD